MLLILASLIPTAWAFRAADVEPTTVATRSPDDVALRFTPGLQLRLGSSRSATAFREQWGLSWIRWDERNASPRFIALGGIPEDQAGRLAADVARLSHVDPRELARRPATTKGDRRILSFDRRYRGVTVDNDYVSLVVTDGKIGAAWARLTPIQGIGDALPGEHIVPLPDGRAVRAFRTESPTLIQYISRLGDVLWSWDPRHFASLSVEYEPSTAGDALQVGAARSVTMTDSGGTTDVTASDGTHRLSGSLDAWLDGPDLAVLDNGAAIHVAGTDSYTVTQTSVSPAAADVLHHFYVVQDWLRARWPSHAWLDTRVPATVRIPATCNAYYSSGTVNFYAEGGGCIDTGRIADVVYHEVGHGIHEYIIESGSFAGDVSEGSADFIAATIRDDATIGNGFFGPGTSIRELASDRRYPDDVTGEVHNDGLIWGSFLWDLREQWRATYGDETGIPMVDEVFLGALQQGPTLTDLGAAVLVADDDDGDLTNSTPHACELEALLTVHGLGAGAIGEINFEHTGLTAQGSATTEYPLQFDLYALTPDCAGLDEDSVQLWYTADDRLPVPGTRIPKPPTSDTAADTAADTAPDTATDTAADTASDAPEIAGYDGWVSLPLSHADVTFSGAIPRQPATSHVRYFMEAASIDGTEQVQTHGGNPNAVYSFWIGDRHAIWCEGFESGFGSFTHGAGTPTQPDTSGLLTDQWQTGAPIATSERSWDPSSPAEGASIAATALNAKYLPNNTQYLSSPTLDLRTAGPMLLFHQARWLTVETAIYDHATLEAGGALLFRNAGGSASTLDTDWVEEDYNLINVLRTPDGPADLSAVRFDWTLSSDQGLEYGGWALDDVCVYDLDDVPGHYRAENVEATDDQATIRVTWENPWITPLGHVRLVRKQGTFPSDANDGEVLLDDTAPVIGLARTYEDAAVNPGDTWYYAVFSAPDGDYWQGGAVEGENADQGATPLPDTGEPHDSALDSDDSTNEDDSANEAEKAAACGCATGSPSGALGAATALAWMLQRRRRR